MAILPSSSIVGYIHYMLDVPCVYMYFRISLISNNLHKEQYALSFTGVVFTVSLTGLVWQLLSTSYWYVNPELHVEAIIYILPAMTLFNSCTRTISVHIQH